MAFMVRMMASVGLLMFASASFFFALAESALFTLGKWQARRLADGNSRQGTILTRLLSEPHDLLATIVLGNTLANGIVVAIVISLIPLSDWTIYLVLPALLFLILMGCEVVPKTLAVRAPELWALRVAEPMEWALRFTRPFQRLAQRINTLVLRLASSRTAQAKAGISDEEYQELLEMAFQQGTLARSEKDIILQIIGLDRRTARDVMRPRSRMTCISDDATIQEMLDAAHRHKHRRLLIYDDIEDTIVGVLNARALLLEPTADLSEVIEFPSFVPASMNLLQLFKSLQRQQRGLAIVLDEFGGTAGAVTMSDILAEIVGRIGDEGEPKGFVMEKLGEGRWRVNGTMSIEDFHREYPEVGEMPGVDTMGGMVESLMEVVPGVGETVVFRGLRFKVTAADDRRVRELLVEKVSASAATPRPATTPALKS